MKDSARRQRLRDMYEAHYDSVWRVLRRMGNDAARADDVTQQAFIVALERLDDIQLGKERAFLCATAVRIAWRELASHSREDLVEAPEAEDSLRLDAQLDLKRQLELLDHLLSRIAEDLRAALVLHDLEGYSQREMADMLNIPEGTAASRLRRAREAFKAQLKLHLARKQR